MAATVLPEIVTDCPAVKLLFAVTVVLLLPFAYVMLEIVIKFVGNVTEYVFNEGEVGVTGTL